MIFNLSRMTFLSVSVLSLTVLSGCSNINSGLDSASNLFSKKAPQSTVKRADPYDNYYGSVKHQTKDSVYRPKIKRTVTKAIFKTTAPKRYVVKKGDTLWGISHKFLNNPAYWPEIWDVNQKVRNPHLIYPGDVLYIYEGGKRRIKQSDGSVVEKLVPQLRIERKGGGEPISTLSSFLVWPRVLDQNTIDNAPYIVNGREANLLIEKDQTVYVKNLADRHAGGRYAIFHTGKKLKDPDSGREFGNEVAYTGFLEVEQPAMNTNIATATVVESLREIRRGDRLLYIEDEKHSLNAPIQMPKHKIRATVMSLFDAEIISGQSQVIAINKGARDGIKAGYTLGIYAPGKTVDDPYAKTKQKRFYNPVSAVKVDLPPSHVATAIVYKVLNGMSYALINESTNEVRKGYKVGNP
ncbi:MAG: LysM peptidoglycan-binding domain-containing protein [Cocleimonas sp.]